MCQRKEMKVQWFLHQTLYGSKGQNVGTLVTHNWPVFDTHSPCANVMARAQGLHIQDGMDTHQHWHNSFSIVFEDSCYNGSTLQVMGMDVTGGEWAIVGGTGVFSCAQGVIHKKLLEKQCHRNIVELDMQFCYTPKQTGNCNCC